MVGPRRPDAAPVVNAPTTRDLRVSCRPTHNLRLRLDPLDERGEQESMRTDVSFLWLEITGKCQLCCKHCYAESGPDGTHVVMANADWRRVIDEGSELGVEMVQFIGGEPTLHPGLPELVDHARGQGLTVEIFSNLVHVSPGLWDVFSQPEVRLATSYYADSPIQHEAITKRHGSYLRTKTNIVEAVRRSIPIRAGLINIGKGQRVDEARAELEALGVTEIDTDNIRQVGRGVRDQRSNSSQLCGGCARGKVAIASNGDVWPCVFARWMPMGNVRETSLAEIATGAAMATIQKKLRESLLNGKCDPLKGKCDPETRCGPSRSDCQPHCPPSYHSDPKKCWPYYYDQK